MKRKKKMMICIDGLSGTGKSTLAKNLKNYFINNNNTCEIIKCPFTSTLFDGLRNRFLSHEIDPLVSHMVFCADMRQTIIEKIIPFQKTFDYIILDRYIHSPFARGLTECIDYIFLYNTLRLITDDFSIMPHKTFILDAEIELLNNRTRERDGEIDYLESAEHEYISRMRDGYIRSAELFNGIVLDATHPENLLHQIIDNIP